MAIDRPRVLSGIQPTAGSFHLGNYLGAVRNWVALQESHDAFYMVVDLHAITVPQDPAALRENTRLAAAQLLAAGLDPERCTLFVQSHVPEHAQLGVGDELPHRLRRGVADDAVQGQVGQAGCRPHLRRAVHLPDPPGRRHPAVPGRRGPGRRGPAPARRADPRPRRAVQRPLRQGGTPTFTVPAPYIVKETAKIYDLQDPTVKMSKSASSPKGLVNLLDDPKASAKKFRSAVTDTDTVVRYDEAAKPGVSNLLTVLRHPHGYRNPGTGGAVRRQGLRCAQDRPRRGVRGVGDPVPRAHPGVSRRPRDAGLRAGRRRRTRRARSPPRRWPRSTSGWVSCPPSTDGGVTVPRSVPPRRPRKGDTQCGPG